MKETPLEDLGPVLKVLAEKVYKHRKANRGFVPREVFEPLIAMDGETASVQIVNEVVDEQGERIGFALKLRDPNEVGDAYRGKYHNTCCSLRMFDSPATALERDTVDTFGFVPKDDDVEFLGVTIHHEESRHGADVTMMHLRQISREQMSKLVGTWRIFTDEEILAHPQNMVESNWWQLEWVMDPNRPPFADIRQGWPQHQS